MTDCCDNVTARTNALIYRNQRLGQIVSMVNAGLLVLIAHLTAPGVVAAAPLLGWLALAIATAALRLGMAARFARLSEAEQSADAAGWRRRALLGALASGCVWAAGGLQLMQAGDTLLQLFTAFVLAGMVAGAVPVLAVDKHVFRAYAWPVVLAAILGGLGSDPLHIAFVGMSILFLLTATRSADNFHATLHESIRLEQEKNALVSHLETARQQAEVSNRTKTEFLANISHELRTPMNGILGLTELLALEELPPDQHEMLAHLDTAARQMHRHVEALIQLSQLEAGQVELRPQPFDLSELGETLLAPLQARARERKLSLQADFDPALPLTVNGDSEQLRQALAHLLDNALKFTDHGTVGLQVRLVEFVAGEARIEFSVSDSGVGMSADTLHAVHDGLMLQADGSAVRRHGGIGLGLPVVRKLVRLLGGELQISSEVGSGSRFAFTLTLPVCEL